jgi:hypothetical protein
VVLFACLMCSDVVRAGNYEFSQTKKLLASDGVADDWFGRSVSNSGDVVVVGAVGDDSNSGSAYIFSRYEGGEDNWGQVKKSLRARVQQVTTLVFPLPSAATW